MKWQNVLSKSDLQHLRKWQKTLTLREFRVNRKQQKQEEKDMRQMGLNAPVCPQCDSIAAKLTNAGIKI